LIYMLTDPSNKSKKTKFFGVGIIWVNEMVALKRSLPLLDLSLNLAEQLDLTNIQIYIQPS